METSSSNQPISSGYGREFAFGQSLPPNSRTGPSRKAVTKRARTNGHELPLSKARQPVQPELVQIDRFSRRPCRVARAADTAHRRSSRCGSPSRRSAGAKSIIRPPDNRRFSPVQVRRPCSCCRDCPRPGQNPSRPYQAPGSDPATSLSSLRLGGLPRSAGTYRCEKTNTAYRSATSPPTETQTRRGDGPAPLNDAAAA